MITIKTVTYPQFDTRGDLNECVARFREWSAAPQHGTLYLLLIWCQRLQNVVIDLEVAAGTPSPTIDPSVRTILVGHSMGGIVAAETLLHIVSDDPIPPANHSAVYPDPSSDPNSGHLNFTSDPSAFMFPFIQGILAFDTPYLGISPSLIAHGAESHYRSATSAYSTISGLAGALGYGASTASSPTSPTHKKPQPKAIAPAPEQAKDVLAASMTASNVDAAATPVWQRWGKYAMFAGAAGAVAAGGAAAFLKKDAITDGWSWVGSHLEFVGCLVRGEELKTRLERIASLNKERGIGFADLYTVLGKGAVGAKAAKTVAGGVVEIGGPGEGEGKKRTFCNLPKSSKNAKFFWAEVNEKAGDETVAHMSMFSPRENPGYYGMGERAKEWVRFDSKGWT